MPTRSVAPWTGRLAASLVKAHIIVAIYTRLVLMGSNSCDHALLRVLASAATHRHLARQAPRRPPQVYSLDLCTLVPYAWPAVL